MIQKIVETRAVVYILPLAKIKLDTYVGLVKDEVSGLGKVSRLGRGELLIEDVYLFDQQCNSASTILDGGKIADFLTDMIVSGEDPSSIRFWWHSHAGMEPFWSATDNDTIYGFNNEWMVSLVTNHAGKYLCRVDAFKPIHMTAENIPLCVLLEKDELLMASLKSEVKEKVKPLPFQRHTYYPALSLSKNRLINIESDYDL